MIVVCFLYRLSLTVLDDSKEHYRECSHDHSAVSAESDYECCSD